MGSVTPGSGSRRERQRAQTIADIKAAARQLLAEAGPTAISLRAIGRDLGMSAPALYRYFPNLEALVTRLCADLYDELGRHMTEHVDRQADPDDPVDRLLAAARGFRNWAIGHRPEFILMFASQVPGTTAGQSDEPDPQSEPYAAMLRFCRVFGVLFGELFDRAEELGLTIRAPQPPPLSARLRAELLGVADALGLDVPIDFAFLFNSFWIRLYGLVAMEVFGQLPLVESSGELFEAELAAMAEQGGIRLAEVHRSAEPTG